jgi:hypothetical protein
LLVLYFRELSPQLKLDYPDGPLRFSPRLTFSSQLGAAVGGLSRTAGGLVGTAGRGLGQTINNTTGTKAVGDGLQGLTNGVEDGVANVARGVEDGSKGKKIW